MSAGFMAGLLDKYPPISTAFLIFPNRLWVRYRKLSEQDKALYQALPSTCKQKQLVGMHLGTAWWWLCPLCLWWDLVLCRDYLQKGSQPFTFMPVEAKFSSYSSFIYHSMFCSKIMCATILLLLNICQASWLTIKNPLVSHWPSAEASFLTLWITVDT